MTKNKNIRDVVTHTVLAGFVAINILVGQYLKSPHKKVKSLMPHVTVCDTNKDGEPDITYSAIACRGYYRKSSRKSTQEEINWYKSQN